MGQEYPRLSQILVLRPSWRYRQHILPAVGSRGDFGASCLDEVESNPLSSSLRMGLVFHVRRGLNKMEALKLGS